MLSVLRPLQTSHQLSSLQASYIPVGKESHVPKRLYRGPGADQLYVNLTLLCETCQRAWQTEDKVLPIYL